MKTTKPANGQWRSPWTVVLILLGVALPLTIVALVPYYHKGDLMDAIQPIAPLEA